jgi:protein-S-isoprenylcysteine O-methyltransferase Ste14
MIETTVVQLEESDRHRRRLMTNLLWSSNPLPMPIDWPSLAVGVIVAAYWARVMRLARKIKRNTGHGANVLPRETTGRIVRIIWYPVVILWITVPIVSAYVAFQTPLLKRRHSIPAVNWAAIGVAIIAFILTLICWRKMGKSWRMGIDPNEKTSLVLTGPYEYVRHPIYALSAVIMLATLAIVPTILMLIVAACHLLLLHWEARREEKYLLSVHGPAYENYMKRVGRFIPMPQTRV